MSRHALIIGSRLDDVEPIDAVMDQVAEYCGSSRQMHVRRCLRLADFADIVREVASGHLLHTLDVFDHGTYGTMYMGDGVLWQSDAQRVSALIGADLATTIEPWLTPTAHIRLLGCDTAGAPSTSSADQRRSGRMLVTKLATIFGRRRVVFGTIRAVGPNMFSPDGFDPEVEESVLYSSLQAIDCDPPRWSCRLRSLGKRDQ